MNYFKNKLINFVLIIRSSLLFSSLLFFFLLFFFLLFSSLLFSSLLFSSLLFSSLLFSSLLFSSLLFSSLLFFFTLIITLILTPLTLILLFTQGTFVLHDNDFKWFSHFSSHGPWTREKAHNYVFFPSGIIRGALKAFGVNCVVTAEAKDIPACSFTIEIIQE
jgi:hypothetical protein